MRKKLLMIAPIGIVIIAILIIAIVTVGGNETESSYIETKAGGINVFDNYSEITSNQQVFRLYTPTDTGTFSIIYPSNILVYNDFETNTYTPLCNKPNCTHDEENCNAWHFSGSYVCLYNNKRYVFGCMGATCSDFDGENRKSIESLIGENITSTPIIDGNCIYYTTYDDVKLSDDDDNPYSSQAVERKMIVRVIKLNLDTNEATNLYTFGENYQTHSEILFIDKDYIYIKHQQQNHPYEEELENPDLGKTDPARTDIYKIDKDTGEEEIILNCENMFIYKLIDNKLYFDKFRVDFESDSSTCENKLYAYDLSTKETSVILTDDLISKIGDDFDYVITDDEIIFNNNFDKKLTIYDLDGNLKKEIDNPGFFITEACSGAYFVNRVNMWSKSLSFVKKSDIDKKEISIYLVGIPQENTN